MSSAERAWTRGVRVALTVAGLLSAVEAGSQETFSLGRWSGFAEVDFHSIEETVTDVAGERLLFDRDRSEQKIGIRNRTVVVDPEFLTLHYGLTLGLLQNRFVGERGETSGAGRLRGYDFHADLFPQRRFSLALLANRYDNVVPQEFAGTLDLETRNYGATLRLRRIFLPSVLSYRDSELETRASADPRSRGRDEVRRRLTYQGSRDWPHQRFELRLELAELDDRLFPVLDHQRYGGAVRHRLEFDGTLEGTLTSSLRWLERDGDFESTSLDADEVFRWRARDNLTTTLRYTLRDLSTLSGTTDTERATITIEHALYESLETELQFDRFDASFPDGRSTRDEVRLALDYTKGVPGDGRIVARIDSSVARQDDRFDQRERFVARESHAVRFGEPFRLERPRVLLDTVLVYDDTAATIFQEGVDYDLFSIGEFAEVTPIPGGGIVDGQIVVVDYRAMTSPRVEFETTTQHFDLALDYGWIAPFVSVRRREDELLEGIDTGLLDDMTIESAGVRLRLRGRWLELQARGEARTYDSRLLDYDQVNSSGSVTYRPHRDWTFTGSANYSWTEFTLPLRDTRLRYARLKADWRVSRGLTLEAFAGERRWNDTLSTDEEYENAGLRARFKVGRLIVSSSLSEWNRVRGGEEFESLRATLRVTRRFLSSP